MRRQILLDLGGFDVGLGRTKEKLHIGEETRVFLQLLESRRRIVYNPAIELWHVIEERAKEKPYLLRYFRDTAESLVYVSHQGAGRRLMGVPLFRIREFAEFYMMAPPRLCLLAMRGDGPGLFFLRLQWIRFSRMLGLYLREWLRRKAGSCPGPGT